VLGKIALVAAVDIRIKEERALSAKLKFSKMEEIKEIVKSDRIRHRRAKDSTIKAEARKRLALIAHQQEKPAPKRETVKGALIGNEIAAAAKTAKIAAGRSLEVTQGGTPLRKWGKLRKDVAVAVMEDEGS